LHFLNIRVKSFVGVVHYVFANMYSRLNEGSWALSGTESVVG
jgi:hypothetical protein